MRTVGIVLLVGIVVAVVGCTSEADEEAAIVEFCNRKADNLAEYSECRCRKLTRSISYTDEMDDCMVNREMYSKGYEGKVDGEQ